jgi:hypothetical protein
MRPPRWGQIRPPFPLEFRLGQSHIYRPWGSTEQLSYPLWPKTSAAQLSDYICLAFKL